MTRPIGPLERIASYVYVGLATTLAGLGVLCALYSLVLVVVWTVEWAVTPW